MSKTHSYFKSTKLDMQDPHKLQLTYFLKRIDKKSLFLKGDLRYLLFKNKISCSFLLKIQFLISHPASSGLAM